MPGVTTDDVIEYADRGYRCFPVTEGANAPPTLAGWPDKATTDMDTLSRWFATGRRNLGIACGERSNLTVLDFDGFIGDATFQHCVRFLGPLPDAPMTLTPGKGFHLWFRYVAGAKNRARLMDGLDIRTRGGYVVAPPSARPDGGYHWSPSLSLGDLEPPVMPEKWQQFLRGELPAANREPAVDRNGSTQPGEAFALPVDGIILAGSRNETMFKYACRLRALMWEQDRALAACYNLRDTQMESPETFDDGEVQRCVESAYRYPAGLSTHKDNGKPVVAQERPALTVVEPTSTADSGLVVEPASRWGRSLEDLVYSPPARVPYLVEDILERCTGDVAQGDVGQGLLIGDKGSGKSWISLHLAYSVSRGLPFFGTKTSKARVGLVTGEGGPRGYWMRCKSIDPEPKNWGNVIQTSARELASHTVGPQHLGNPGMAEALILWCRMWEIDLLILDPLFKFTLGAGDTNKEDVMSPVMANLTYIQRESPCSLLITHHPRKSSGENGWEVTMERSRGSSAIYGPASTVWTFSVHKTGTKRLRYEHVRDSQPPPDVWLKHASTSPLGYGGNLMVVDRPKQGDREDKLQSIIPIGDLKLWMQEVGKDTGGWCGANALSEYVHANPGLYGGRGVSVTTMRKALEQFEAKGLLMLRVPGGRRGKIYKLVAGD